MNVLVEWRSKLNILKQLTDAWIHWPPYKPDVLWKRVLFTLDDGKWNTSSSHRIFHLHFRHMSLARMRKFAVTAYRVHQSCIYINARNYNKLQFYPTVNYRGDFYLGLRYCSPYTRFDATLRFTVFETRYCEKSPLPRTVTSFNFFSRTPILNLIYFFCFSCFIFIIYNPHICYIIILRNYHS